MRIGDIAHENGGRQHKSNSKQAKATKSQQQYNTITMWGNQNPPAHNTTTTDTDNNSLFGDAYSIQSKRSMVSNHHRQSHDLEVDYDQSPTTLYRAIEQKDWDTALNVLSPDQAKTWVSRRDATTGKTRWRLLPLHAVCIFRAPLSLMEALIEAYETSPQLPDDQGMLPVHLACRNGASKGVVLTLLAAYPKSIFVKDRKGRSLFDLVRNSSSTNKDSVLKALGRFEQEMNVKHAVAAESVKTTNNNNIVDYDNRTVLFRCILKKDWKAANKRMQTHPEEASIWIATKGFHGNLKFLPIHKACVLQPPIDLIQSLLQANASSAYDTDQDGWLPIHCACFYNADDAIIQLLLQSNEKGVSHKDDDGRLPLHYACLKGASSTTVDLLLATNAKSSLVKDHEGRLAVHHACSKGAPEAIIDNLLKAAPKSAQSKDDQGRLALHHACRKNATERVVRTLLKVYARAASIKDDQDKLPLHYICQHGGTVNMAQLLIQAYPEGINAKNSFGNTPLDDAKEAVDAGNLKMDAVVQVLVEAKQTVRDTAVQESKADKSTIRTLESRISVLESTLKQISFLGKDLKSAVRKKKNVTEIIDRFADDLIQMNGSKIKPTKQQPQQRSTSTSKGRSTTPSRGLFGRSSNNANRQKA